MGTAVLRSCKPMSAHSHFAPGAFDVVVSLDVVEHFDKPDAHRVIGEMERASRFLVVVVTPCGYVRQSGTPDEPWQEHRCGFEPDELEALGYEVSGVGGPARSRAVRDVSRRRVRAGRRGRMHTDDQAPAGGGVRAARSERVGTGKSRCP